MKFTNWGNSRSIKNLRHKNFAEFLSEVNKFICESQKQKNYSPSNQCGNMLSSGFLIIFREKRQEDSSNSWLKLFENIVC